MIGLNMTLLNKYPGDMNTGDQIWVENNRIKCFFPEEFKPGLEMQMLNFESCVVVFAFFCNLAEPYN